MQITDFFTEANDDWEGPQLKRDLLQRILLRPLPDVSDLDVAYALVDLAHKELTAFGTYGDGHIQDDDDMRLVLRSCMVACLRVGVQFPSLPFRDLSTFRKYWNSAGMSGSYKARRDFLNEVFQPIEDELNRLYFVTLDRELAQAVSPGSGTGWVTIDGEISELRSRFKIACTEQDYCAVGAACVRILEHLGEAVFDENIHLEPGAEVPTRDKTKTRFEAVISHSLAGSDHEGLRKLARAIIEVSHGVKHRTTPTRRDAGIAADSVILLANIMRRLTPEKDRGSQESSEDEQRNGRTSVPDALTR